MLENEAKFTTYVLNSILLIYSFARLHTSSKKRFYYIFCLDCLQVLTSQADSMIATAKKLSVVKLLPFFDYDSEILHVNAHVTTNILVTFLLLVRGLCFDFIPAKCHFDKVN